MEIPDDLYRRAKTRAAAQNRKVKDLVPDVTLNPAITTPSSTTN